MATGFGIPPHWRCKIRAFGQTVASFKVAFIHNHSQALGVAKDITALLEFPDSTLLRNRLLDWCSENDLDELLDIAGELPAEFSVAMINPQGVTVHEGLSMALAAQDMTGVQVVWVG
jgi:hypothetical protein